MVDVSVYDIKNLKGVKEKGMLTDVKFIPYSHGFAPLDDLYDRETFIDIAPLPLGSMLRFTDFIIRRNPDGKIARTGSTISYQYIEGLYVAQDENTKEVYLIADNHGAYVKDEIRSAVVVGGMKMLEPMEQSGNIDDDEEDIDNSTPDPQEMDEADYTEEEEAQEEKPSEADLRQKVFDDLNNLEKMADNTTPEPEEEPEEKKEETPRKVPVHMQQIPPVQHAKDSKKPKKFNKKFDDNGNYGKKNKKKKWDRNAEAEQLASPQGLFADPNMNALFDKLTK